MELRQEPRLYCLELLRGPPFVVFGQAHIHSTSYPFGRGQSKKQFWHSSRRSSPGASLTPSLDPSQPLALMVFALTSIDERSWVMVYPRSTSFGCSRFPH